MSKKKLKKNSISLKSFGLGDELREKICQIIFFFLNKRTNNKCARTQKLYYNMEIGRAKEAGTRTEMN